MADVQSAITYLAAQPEVEASRLGLYGTSYGGALPDRQSAELGMAARRNNPAAVTTIPLEFVDDTLSFNPEWVVDQIAPRPVLFITSDNDRLVPAAESEALYARAGEPKKLVVLKRVWPLRSL